VKYCGKLFAADYENSDKLVGVVEQEGNAKKCSRFLARTFPFVFLPAASTA